VRITCSAPTIESIFLQCVLSFFLVLRVNPAKVAVIKFVSRAAVFRPRIEEAVVHVGILSLTVAVACG
jgi:hypothetical protein